MTTILRGTPLKEIPFGSSKKTEDSTESSSKTTKKITKMTPKIASLAIAQFLKSANAFTLTPAQTAKLRMAKVLILF